MSGQTPTQHLEWVMMFPTGRRASAVMRTDDVTQVEKWAAAYSSELVLHRRIVLEGIWIPEHLAVPVQLRHDLMGSDA